MEQRHSSDDMMGTPAQALQCDDGFCSAGRFAKHFVPIHDNRISGYNQRFPFDQAGSSLRLLLAQTACIVNGIFPRLLGLVQVCRGYLKVEASQG
jgi:hypothetical protein